MLRRLLHRGHDDSRALSHYWDEVVHQSPVTAMPAERAELDLRSTIRSLHGLAEAEQEQAPFTESLLRQIQAQREEYVEMMSPDSAALPRPRALDLPEARSRPRAASAWFPTRLTVAAVVALFAITSLILSQLNGGDDNPAILAPTAGTPAATGTIPAQPSPAATVAVPSYPGRDVPGEKDCTAEPYSAIPVAINPPNPPDLPNYPFAAPHGDQADAETVAAVTALVRGETACLNTNDIRRVLSYYTDMYAEALFGTEGITQIENGWNMNDRGYLEEGIATPVAEIDRTAVIAVLDVEMLGPDLAGAYVVLDHGQSPEPVNISYYYFQRTANGWLINGSICYNVVGHTC
jgi:hypothetical protein